MSKDENKQEVCPNCGYCPCCGRSNQGVRLVPMTPYPWYPTPTYPGWWGTYTVTSGETTPITGTYTTAQEA